MDMITISAKTLDEAITKALLELQTTSDHLYYEVVQKESSGFFGVFGAKPCIIRTKVMTETEENAIKKASEKQEMEAAATKEIAGKIGNLPERKNETGDEKKAVEEKLDSKPAKLVAGTVPIEPKKTSEKRNLERRDFEKKNQDHRRNDRRDGTRRERLSRKKDVHAEKPEELEKHVKEERPRQPVKADPEKVQTVTKEFLVNIFGAMGMEVSIQTKLNLEEGEMLVMMEGEDMGVLIGKRGQTLDSLQYLVSLVANKETEGYLRVKLDTENYRERRKETLETLARNISYKVKRTKRPVSLEPMNPYERRIIHSALQNDRYVVTRSEGEDPYRHVVISLKNDRYNSKREHYSHRSRERVFEKAAQNALEAAAEMPEEPQDFERKNSGEY